MQIKQLEIRNFRGIKSLNCKFDSPVICLIGPGDSTKTTILDAIEYCLSPKWNLYFDDSDFYNGDIKNNIEIVVHVCQLPEELTRQEKFGLLSRGWNESEGLHDEPKGKDQTLLSIRLQIDESLEPIWTVFCDRDVEGKPINSRDRGKININRLSDYVDKHLSWGQGSALVSISQLSKQTTTPIIIDALRRARDATKIDEIQEFLETIEIVKKSSANVGVRYKNQLSPALDPKAINITQSAISLHDGNVPLRLYGLGSRRLIALGIQFSCVDYGACLLIDEFENGLEPHRIRRLLNFLCGMTKNEQTLFGQVIMTSHSPIVIEELDCSSIQIVRSINGNTTVQSVSTDLQGTVRSVPDSLLGEKVLLCEGKTELGICRSFEQYWINSLGRNSIAYQGVVLAEGVGDNSEKRALQLKDLGYDVCLFIDGDKIEELNPNLETLSTKGVHVFHWKNSLSTDQQVINDFPFSALHEIMDLAITNFGESSVLDSTCSKIGESTNNIGKSISEWKQNEVSEDSIRSALGNAAKKHGWFKRIDYGEELGKVIISHLTEIAETETFQVMDGIEAWIYGR